MFDIVSAEDATIKFNMYLKSYINSSLSKSYEIDKKLKSGTLYDELASNKVPYKFIKLKSELVKIDPTFDKYIRIIEYFVENNIPNVPQVEDAMNAILNSESMSKKRDEIELKEKRKQLDVDIERCRKIINGEEVEYDFYLSMLDKSFLTNREELDILLTKCYESTKLVKEKELDTPSIIEIADEFDIGELSKEYEKLKIEAETFISKYYHLIESDNTRQCTYAKELANSIRGIEDIKIYSTLDKKLIILVFYLIRLKREIESLISSDRIDGESLSIELMFLSDALEEAKSTSIDYNQELKEEIMPSTSSISILDVYGLTFDVERFNDKEKARLESLIKSLDAGNHDYILKNGDHSKMIQNIISDSVYINRDYKTNIAYIRVTPDKALIIHASNGDIFKETMSVLKKNRLSIEKQIELIRQGDEDYTKQQIQVLSSLLSKLDVEKKEATL